MKAARVIVGIAVSAVFGWLTLSRVDLQAAGQALGRATVPGLCLAFSLAWMEIGARTWRWKFLLSPLGRVGYRQVFAYACIGYFANTLLPMRLGDIARGYLAATALRLPRLATLGSIVTERLADGLTILILAAVLGLFVDSASTLGPVEVWAFLAALSVVFVVAVIALLTRYADSVARLMPERVHRWLAKLVRGSEAARTARGMATVVGATLVAYACAVATLLAVAESVGLHLSIPQAAFAMAWIGLSTAIPAAPGSVGTYEFVGMTVLTMLGQDPASSLAAVVLLHVIGTLPVAVVGLAMTWALHLRLWRLGIQVEAAPAACAGSEPVAEPVAVQPA